MNQIVDRGEITPLSAEDVGRRVGVSRQRVWRLATHPNFPPPIRRLGPVRLWVAGDIRTWDHLADHPKRTRYHN